MKLSDDDKQLLQELCEQHQVSFEKVTSLLATEAEYEFKTRRTGIYDDLRKVLTDGV